MGHTFFSCKTPDKLSRISEPVPDTIHSSCLDLIISGQNNHISIYIIFLPSQNTIVETALTSLELANAASSPAFPLMTVACHSLSSSKYAASRVLWYDRSHQQQIDVGREGMQMVMRVPTLSACFTILGRTYPNRVKHDWFPVDICVSACRIPIQSGP